MSVSNWEKSTIKICHLKDIVGGLQVKGQGKANILNRQELKVSTSNSAGISLNKHYGLEFFLWNYKRIIEFLCFSAERNLYSP